MKNVNLKSFVNVTKTYKDGLIKKYIAKVRKTNGLSFLNDQFLHIIGVYSLF